MTSFAGNSPVAQLLSTFELQERIIHVQEKKTTGLAKTSLLSGEEMLLIFRNGDLRQIYFKGEGIFKRVSEHWNEHLQSGQQVYFSIQSLPVSRLFFEKAILETPDTGKEKKSAFKTSDLARLFLSMEDRESASLVHTRWQTAEAFVLVPGSKIPQRQAIFSSENVIEENSAAIGCIQKYPDAECELTIYRGGLESEAWLELHLKILFEALCSHLFTQYGYLTGRVMVTSVIQNLMIFSSQSGWDINRIGSEVVDQTIFSSAAAAGDAYREMLALIGEHLTTVLGPALFQSVERQGLVSVSPFYQNLTKMYKFFE